MTKAVIGLYEATGDRRFAFDCYRRFIQMFGNVVWRFPLVNSKMLLPALKSKEGVTEDQNVSAEGLESLTREYKQIIVEKTGIKFPQDPYEQTCLCQ